MLLRRRPGENIAIKSNNLWVWCVTFTTIIGQSTTGSTLGLSPSFRSQLRKGQITTLPLSLPAGPVIIWILETTNAVVFVSNNYPVLMPLNNSRQVHNITYLWLQMWNMESQNVWRWVLISWSRLLVFERWMSLKEKKMLLMLLLCNYEYN